MAPPKNHELKREKDCFAVTPERKYYRSGDTFIKRNLRPGEWQQHNGYLHVPLFNFERIMNEAACLQFVAENTNIPIPKLIACFEDDGAAYLVTEYVEGVGMTELTEKEQDVVVAELEQHLATLHALTSDTWGGPNPGPGPGGVVLPPHRVMRHSDRRPYRLRPRETADLVFCHNDLSAPNVIVDPSTLKINAIIDWEYAGFYPPEFERAFYLRSGPSVALDGEENDEAALMALLDAAKEE